MREHDLESMTRIDLKTKIRMKGFSERHIGCAMKLLESLEYDPDALDWNERRRFTLFDKLSQIAFFQAVTAENLGEDANGEYYDYSLVAQCAMEIVFDGKPFSSDLLNEMCVPAATPDLYAAA